MSRAMSHLYIINNLSILPECKWSWILSEQQHVYNPVSSGVVRKSEWLYLPNMRHWLSSLFLSSYYSMLQLHRFPFPWVRDFYMHNNMSEWLVQQHNQQPMSFVQCQLCNMRDYCNKLFDLRTVQRWCASVQVRDKLLGSLSWLFLGEFRD